MPRKGPAPRRELLPDPIYRSVLVTQIVNKVLQSGKRSTAERIVYDALAIIEEKTGADPVTSSPEEFGKFIQSEFESFRAAVRAAKLAVE